MGEYTIDHKRRGCYEVCYVEYKGEARRSTYLTNFKNKKAAQRFVEAHSEGKVEIDSETCIPVPDFK